MAKKAYIVANKQQEREVLDKLEREGMTWSIINEKPTDFNPRTSYLVSFPYVIFVDDVISWNFISRLEDEEIVFDGRKEEQMSDKYVVSQEFMNDLEEWKESNITDSLNEKYHYTSIGELDQLPGMIKEWWLEDFVDKLKTNNRLIAIIRWVNGEDVFEVEKPKKWVVRSKGIDEDGDYGYVLVGIHGIATTSYNISRATKFDTKEKAESWANAHQEVVEVNE